ncbi:hypothetical protein Tco_1408820 [Tanacetum coccineum]
MLVQPTKDEGAISERPSEAQPTPSPPHPSEATIEPQSNPSPRPFTFLRTSCSFLECLYGNQGVHSSSDKSISGNEGDMTLQSVYDLCISLCTQVSDQTKEIQNLKAQIKKLKKQSKPPKRFKEKRRKELSFRMLKRLRDLRPNSSRSLFDIKASSKDDLRIKGRRKLKREVESESEYKGQDEDFIAIGVLLKMKRMIKEMNEKGIDSSKNESVKEEGKEEEGTKKRKSGHIKMIARKKPRKQSDDDSDDEHRNAKIVTFEGLP